jgi:hypothetical protein
MLHYHTNDQGGVLALTDAEEAEYQRWLASISTPHLGLERNILNAVFRKHEPQHDGQFDFEYTRIGIYLENGEINPDHPGFGGK